MIVKDEALPTGAEKITALICELMEDVEALHRRLDGNKPRSMARMQEERRKRWQQVLAIVEAAVEELAEQRRQAEAVGRLQ
jgi:hypothetical protein